MGELVLLAIALACSGFGSWWLLARLRTLPTGPARRGEVPSVSVVVPSRDEETALPVLLSSLARQSLPLAEVLVVDDESTDGTAAVAAGLGAHVVSPGPPPPGWTGKAWACQAGADAATGDLLLFLDADTDLAPEALAGLVEVHRVEGGLVSVQPFHHVVRVDENLSAYFNAVAVLASGAFARTTGSRPMAFGPCLLTDRGDHRKVGGHAAVRTAVLDDVELAAVYRGAGLPVTCLVGGRSMRMRSYPRGWRELAAGWTKNFASGAGATDPRSALLAVIWVSTHHAVAVGALASLLDVVAGLGLAPSADHTAPWLVAWAVVSWQVRAVLRRVGDFRWWTWVCFPIPLLAFDLIFLRSVVRTWVHRSVSWRGRVVQLADPSPDREAT